MKAQNDNIKITVSFLLLFSLYHTAEYLFVFKNSIAGFFAFQFLFFFSAWLLGNWYKGTGLNAWGLRFNRSYWPLMAIGVITGIAVYAIPYVFSITTKIESIVVLPKWWHIAQAALPFAIGVLFSSFSEDVLTRGLVYTHLQQTVKPLWLVLLSALIYLLNHIYRLNDGVESLLYIFLLGIIFMIPVWHTKNLWFTGSMHWAGNTFFFITHNVVQTENKSRLISSNYLFSAFLFLFIPIIWWLSKCLGKLYSTKRGGFVQGSGNI